jgi:DNA-binding CsgD family transcriptional regulator
LGGGGAPRSGSAEPLIGRDREVEFLRSFIDQSAAQGGALLLSGDAGLGKTELLDAAAAHAAAAGTRVLRAAGAEFEADLSFAALNQVLYPLLGGLEQLSALHGKALRVALGLSDGSPADQLVVSNAALALVLQAAAARPVLVIVDDLPWVDRASAVVLGFVARRLAGSRVGFLAAYRSGEESFFERSGLPGYELEPLDETAAAALIGDRFPALAPRVRQRLLADAQGNPLALLELPVALSGPQRAGALPAVLPLSQRLQSLFASRVSGLPAATRDLLLLAVLEGTGDLGVLRGTASGQGGIEDLAPAERARLVHVDHGTGRLTFRHPLTRSAVVELSTSDQRRRVHAVLAKQLTDQPERRAWHLAEAAVGPNQEVARLLEQAANVTLRRGDAVGAIAALLRAADLSPGGRERSRRLALAAYLGADVTGDLRNVPQLLEKAHRADPERAGSLAAAVAASAHLLNGDGDIDTAHRLLVGAIEMQPGPYDADDTVLIEALYTLLLVCFFGGRSELWEPFETALRQVQPQVPDTLAVLSKTFPDPARTALPALGQLDAAIAGLRQEADPVRIVRVGIAAAYVDRLAGCREALWRVVRHGREGGAVTSAIEALFLLGNHGFLAGQWEEVAKVCDEGLRLCDAHSYRLLAWPGLFLRALLAATGGHAGQTQVLTDQMTRWAAPRRIGSVHHYAAHAKALAALGQGDFEDAYQHATAVSPAGVLAAHIPHALWLVMDLVEAAMRTGRHAEAAAHVAAVREADLAAISPRLALITGGSAAIAAPDHQAGDLFEEALAIPGADRWPFDLARIQLAYGERLRRTKATTHARSQLAAALDTFQRLGAQPWAARAGNELRATGLSRGQAAASGGQVSLTPQQREIAQLAAAGLTNKQIGERLFLSPRTVATHLYQLFPKLGVASRAALRDALAALPAEQPQDEQGLPPSR